MVNLVKNELSKIFHKKALYIMLTITLGFMILISVMNKVFENFEFFDEDISFYEEEIKNIDKNNPEEKDMYYYFTSMIEIGKLKQNYEKDSWQRFIIDRQGEPLVQDMIRSEGTPEYEKNKKAYEDFKKKLDLGDWKAFAKVELEESEEEIKALEEISNDKDSIALISAKYEKQVIEWRIEKDIPYGTTSKNQILDQWLDAKQQLVALEEQEKTKSLTYNEKYQKQELEETVALTEYAIKNNVKDNINILMFNSRDNLTTEATGSLIDVYAECSLFIIISIVIVAGTIVSEEFNKGTVKLLLVKPYTRIKILIAKFISCLIVLAIVLVIVSILQFIVGGFANGFGNYESQVTIYNLNTHNIENIGTIKYLLLTAVAILPQFLLLMTLSFALSTIFVSSPIAIAIPMLGMTGASIINEIAYNYEKAKFLKFFVTPNWDLSIYLFGKLPQFEPISLPFSVIVCLVYFVVMILVSMAVFKSKEIKNI